MASVTVRYGLAYDGKNQELFAKCLQRIRRNESQTCLYLVRTDARKRQLRERAFSERAGCFRLPVSTLPDSIKTLYQSTPSPRHLLRDLEQKLLIETILEQQQGGSESAVYFRQFREHPGIVGKLKDFLNAFRSVGLTEANALKQTLTCVTSSSRPLHNALVDFLARYCQQLDTLHLIDEPGIFLEIARQANRDELDLRPLVRSPELLVLEGYYELSAPLQQIFTALSARFEQTFITLDLPGNPYHLQESGELPRPFRIVQNFVDYLCRAGFSVRGPSVGVKSPAKELSEAERLWSEALKQDPEAITSERISLHSYLNRKEEITAIARRVRQLHRNGKIDKFREIGVTFPLIETYEPLIREIFPMFGLPFSMFQGYSLASSPVVVTIMRFLNICLEDYSREALSHFFAVPLMHCAAVEATTQASERFTLEPLVLNAETFPHLDLLARQLGVECGKTAWEKIFTEYIEQIRENYPEPPYPAAYYLIPALRELLNLVAEFDKKSDAVSPQSWVALLKSALQRLRLLPNLLHEADRYLRERDATAFRVFVTVLNTLQQDVGSTTRQWTLKKFVDVLHTAVRGETYYPPHSLEDGLLVMGRLDPRQVRFRYLFFGGLVEKDFPGQDSPNIFLSEQEAETLGLATTYAATSQECDYLFYLNALNPTEHLFLSYPCREDEKDMLRSTYIERLEKVFKAQEERDGILASDADGGGVETKEQPSYLSLRDCYTHSELSQWLGVQRNNTRVPETLDESPLVPAALKYLSRAKGAEFTKRFLNGFHAQMLRHGDIMLSAFDGVLSSNWATRQIQQRHASHVFSVSEFDLYGGCPMKYFFRRLLRVAPLPLIEPEMSASDIGALLHKIVFRFYADADSQESGRVDSSFLGRKIDKKRWIAEAGQRIAEITRQELAGYHFSDAFWEAFRELLLSGLFPPQASDVAESVFSPSRKGLLAKFIEVEALDADNAAPFYLEAHFGMPSFEDTPDMQGINGYLLSKEPLKLCGTDSLGERQTIRLRGKIDRLDLESSGGNKAVIYDYKTGRVPSSNKVKLGKYLQLPLYLLAAQEFLGAEYDVVAGGYYQLRSPQEIGKKGLMGSKESAEQGYFRGNGRSLFLTESKYREWLTQSVNLAICLSQAIRQGRFHPTIAGATEAGCRYCDYQQICRVDHQRMRRLFKATVTV